MKKLSIGMKILLPTAILVVLGFSILTTIVMVQFSSTSTTLQDAYSEEFAYHNVYKVTSLLEAPLNEARSLATVLGEAQKDSSLTREDVVQILDEWLSENDIYLGVYTGWESNAFDGKDSSYVNKPYHDKTGRFVPYILRSGNEIVKEALVGYDTDAYYQDPKNLRHEIITNPYEYVANGETLNLVSMVAPIIVDGEFKGIVGVDIKMDQLQSLADDTKLFDSGYIAVVSSDATVVAHQNRAVIYSKPTDFFNATASAGILNAIENASVFSTTNISASTGLESKVVFAATEVGDTGSNWAVMTSVPLSELHADTTKVITIGTILAVIFILLIIGLLIFIVNRFIANPITYSINSISESAGQVSYSSKQLSESSQQLSEGATEQAASIEETSATMDETSSMVKQNADNTRQANNLSKEASEAAAVGSKRMGEMTESMEELKKSSGDISKIIKVIDDIAFQTNMLALNAAVEAARAGDAGQGFAVVAEEVRNLAQKSAKAAKDTAEIIDRNIDLSERGVSISVAVNESLEEIMQKTSDVNQLMDEISAASDEQAKGTRQVTEAIGQMEVVVQSNAASSEESAASAEELRSQAANLENIVIELNKLVKGQKSSIGKNSEVDQKAMRDDYEKSVASSSSSFSSVRTYEPSANDKKVTTPDDIIPLDDEDDF